MGDGTPRRAARCPSGQRPSWRTEIDKLTTADVGPPATGSAARSRSPAAGKTIKVKAISNKSCALKLTGAAKPKDEKRRRLAPMRTQLQAGVAKTLKLKPSRKPKRTLKQAGNGTAKLTGTSTGATGNRGRDTATVRLR